MDKICRSLAALYRMPKSISNLNNSRLLNHQAVFPFNGAPTSITTNFNHVMKRYKTDTTNKTHIKINDLITKNGKRVFVFMKGVPKAPACGYSNVVVQILEAYGVDFDSFDVLEDDEVRQEIKTYSEWPTIPQVYVDGKFVGGCDILLQMHQSDELKSLFEEKKGTEG